MGIRIKNVRAEELARQVARETGESLADAIIHSLEERLERLQGRCSTPDPSETLIQIGRRCSALPNHDTRDAEDILVFAVGKEEETRPPLGSRLPARFARMGLTKEEIPELRDQPARPADFES
jgi:antitoxin VapB